MLQKLREHSSGWIAKIILALLVFVFSFFGIETYFQARSDTSLAHVGSLKVSQQEFQEELNNLRQQAQNPQSGLNPDDFSTPEFRRQVVERLINQKLLAQANDDLGIVVSNDMVRDAIAAVPAFQINGKFDQATYKAILGQQGMTAMGFEQKVRDELSLQIIPNAVTGSALATKADVDTYLRLRDQTRDVRYVELPVPTVDPASVSDADIQAWYKSHQDDYMTPETVSLHYLEVKAADMHTDAEVGEDALRERYEKEKDRYVAPAQREVSHILVSVPPNASPEQQKKALARANELEKKLKEGADFAELAKKDSDDLGSKRQGGNLGWIEPGMTDPAFDEVAFKLDKGEVSSPVLSPEGYHIIKVNEIKPGHTKTFAEVKDQLRHELLGSERERKYNEVAGKLYDLVYQDPNSLQPAAKALDLKIQSAGPFSRQGGSGIAANPKVVEAAFSDQVLNQNMTSDPIKLGNNDVVVIHVDKHTSAKPRPLAEVKDQVRSTIVQDRVDTQARKHAEAMLAKIEKGSSLESLAKSDDLEVKPLKGAKRMMPDQPPQMIEKLFKMPHPEKGEPSVAMFDAGQGKYRVMVLDAVHPGDPAKTPDAEREMLASQLQQLRGSADVMELLKALRASTDVEVKMDQMQNPAES